jgi:NADP-dependent 3-hydroxy acid dehydrogenase YdfG
MKSKQVVLITGSSTGFGASCNRRGISEWGEFSEAMVEVNAAF